MILSGHDSVPSAMSIQHTARPGKAYFLHVGQGKSGKPNYFIQRFVEHLGQESFFELF